MLPSIRGSYLFLRIAAIRPPPARSEWPYALHRRGWKRGLLGAAGLGLGSQNRSGPSPSGDMPALKSMRMRFLAGVNEGTVKSMRMRFLVGVTEGTHGCAPKSMRMRFLVGVTEGAQGCAPKSMRMRFLVGVTEGAHGAENAAESTPPHPEPKK